MSLTMSIPVSGNLANIDGLQLRKNRQNKSVLYFKLVVVEDGRNGGQKKPHFLSCSLTGNMADNLHYAIQNGFITTQTRLNAVLGLDTYTKPFNDPSNGNQVDVQQTSYPVWEIGVSARFAPMADVNSPGFQRLMNGQAPQQGGQQYQQNQGYAPQQGGFPQQNQPQAPQQGGQYQQGGYNNQPQQGGFPQQNQAPAPQQGGFPQQSQQGGFSNQPQPGDQQYQQNQAQAPQQGGFPQQNQPQQQEQGRSPQPQQGRSMREQPMTDGDDF